MSRRRLGKLDGLMESLGRLKSVWASQDIECGVPATRAELAEFEERHRVCLPDDLRVFPASKRHGEEPVVAMG